MKSILKLIVLIVLIVLAFKALVCLLSMVLPVFGFLIKIAGIVVFILLVIWILRRITG